MTVSVMVVAGFARPLATGARRGGEQGYTTMSERSVFAWPIVIDNAQVVAALAVMSHHGNIHEYVAVLQYEDGHTALVLVRELVSGEEPAELLKRFDEGGETWNRTAAMQEMLERAGYARMDDDDCP